MFDSDTEQARTNRVFKLTNNSYGASNFDSQFKRTVQNYDLNFVGKNGGNEDSGVYSPTRSPNYENQQNSYRSLSPAQKSYLVAKGQRELMEMIRNMPESSYELSLKDIVDHPRIMEQQLIENDVSDHGLLKNRGTEEEKKKLNNYNYNYNCNKGRIKRNGSLLNNGGFLLKMGFPISWGSRKKKNGNSETKNTLSKVSPRPSMDGSGKISVDKEWWKKKKFSDSGGSESGGVSSNSGSTGSRSTDCSSAATTAGRGGRLGRSCSPGCWSIFRLSGRRKDTE